MAPAASPSPTVKPTAVAMIHAAGDGPVRRIPNHWAKPRIAPVIAPPANAGPGLSTRPTTSAANPPAGNPRNVGIHSRAVFTQLRDAVAVAVVVVVVAVYMAVSLTWVGCGW